MMRRKAFPTVIIVPIRKSKTINPKIPAPRNGELSVGCILALVDSVEFIAEDFWERFLKVSQYLCVDEK